MARDWQPSVGYLEYVATMKKYGTLRLDRESSEAVACRLDTHVDPTPALVALMRDPFSPCERYQPIPSGCATCAHSIEDVVCPDLKEVFRDVFSPMEGGGLSIRRGSTHDGSFDCSGPGTVLSEPPGRL